MGETTDSNATLDIEQNAPRAIIHKQILDHAEANPGESMEAIADAVSGATTATVERVLEEYGDPAADTGDDLAAETGDESSTTETGTSEAEAATSDAKSNDGDRRVSDSDCAVADGGATSERTDVGMAGNSPAEGPIPAEQDADRDGDTDASLDRSALTEKQHETLRAIYHHPDATQAELADRLGVSSPTISQRVNSIEGFDWSNRDALVAPLFDSGDGEEEEPMPHSDDTDNGADSSERDGDEGTVGDPTDESRDEPSDRTRRRTDRSAPRSDRAPADAADRPDEGAQLADLADRLDELTDRLAAVEHELEGREDGTAGREGATTPSVLADPELAHKIVHACLHSDRISEEEELRLLRDVTAAGAAAGRDEDAPNSI
ncbi:helix-turn-helix domain-containing protein [Haloterrigena salinisoli]|uniref:MarR family transcriptional regulator n=1 Tax=Haloterrigena salinisoli TaxID=3132747 RepID=UPI0030CB4B81